MKKKRKSYTWKGLNSQLFLFKWPHFYSAVLVGRDNTETTLQSSPSLITLTKRTFLFFNSATE